jgi:hypothetical protein
MESGLGPFDDAESRAFYEVLLYVPKLFQNDA